MPVITLVLVAGSTLRAQQASGLTLTQAVENALRNYPSVRVSQEQINAAAAGIQLARTAYLPRVDALAQVNRATRNNVFGLLLPQSVLPAISGPVLGTNNSEPSGAARSECWSPGSRSISVCGRRMSRLPPRRERNRRRRCANAVRVGSHAADAYLTLAAAQETVRAAQAGVDRADVVLRTITALVNAQLRPGADASRAEAELAAARTQLIQAQQAVEVARATLSQFVGVEPAQIAVSAPRLLQLPPGAGGPQPSNTGGESHAAMEQNAVVEQTGRSSERWNALTFPRFYLQGSAYARGTGAETNGDRLGGLNGLAPNVQNYALGFTRDLPGLRSAGDSRAGSRAVGHDPRADGPVRADRDRPARPVESGGRDASRARGGSPPTRPSRSPPRAPPTQQATARYRGGSRQHRRGGGSAAAAHPGRDRRRAGPPRRLARAARRRRRGRRYPAVRRRGEPVSPSRSRKNMRLVLAALSRPITVVVALIAIALCAVLALQRMPVDIFPQVGDPAIYVAQPYGGMDPAQMEGYLTYYYEYHFLYITGIDHVESKSIQGAALMKLVFHEGTNMSQAMAETVGYVNRARAFMPPGTVPPFITRFDAGSVAVGQLVFSSATRTQGEMQDFALNRVRPLFATLPGVSAPPPFGGNQRTIVVTLDPGQAAAVSASRPTRRSPPSARRAW